jgi:uncharacterized membrane protein
MWTRRELKEEAKICFKATYWRTVLVSIIIMLFTGGAYAGSSVSNYFPNGGNANSITEYAAGSSVHTTAVDITAVIIMAIIGIAVALIIVAVAFLIAAFIVNPIVVGCSRYFVRNLNGDTEVKEALSAFDKNYKNSVKIMFFRDLYTLLWSLLFIIPGVIKGYEYRMIPYLLAENPEMSMEMAFSLSKQMMQGNKWKAFVLDLSFILWHLLSVCTCGILEVFYVAPYINMTNAALYQALKGNYQSRQAQMESGQIESNV